MARTAEDKLRIARRAYKDVVNYDIAAHDIFFDPLALPISTGIEADRKNADDTIKAIKQMKEEMPEANVILGVSNISFGLNPAARVVLNSVFLHDAVEAGMSSAIVNAIKILPLNRFNEREIEVARELIYDKRQWNADTPVRNTNKLRNARNVRDDRKKGWHNRGYLPHFDGDVNQFVTFRLADSLPQNVLRRFKEELVRDNLSENSDEYRNRIEKYLDQGIGSCILKTPAIAEIVCDTIVYENGRSCKVISWVVMPNHVHILLRPLTGHSLSDIMKRIKGVSARKINKATGSSGSVWQPDYFDRFIRDEEHFSKTVQYIENNPVKAGLCKTAEEWTFIGSNRNTDTPVRTLERKEKQADKSVRVPGDVCTYDPLIEFTTMFEGKKRKSLKQDISDLPIEEKLQRHIIDGEKIGLEDSLNTALKKYEALEIINVHLLGGMKIVGELFGSGQMQLPFVLQSAESMKTAVKFLEPFMDKIEGMEKGTMVLATVKGDVHDIGKNLVDIILTNNGYKVVNLGIKQTIDAILDANDKYNPNAIGMSGLLVKSTLVMRDNLQIMNERGIDTPVVLGGAALNRRYVDNDLVPLFDSKLFYARDAFDGLNAMDELTSREPSKVQSPKSKAAGSTTGARTSLSALSAKHEQTTNIQTVSDPEDLVGEDAKLGKQAARVSTKQTGDTSHTTKSDISPADVIPTAPFYGSKVVEIKDLTKIFDFINKTALFKGQWQYKQSRKTKEEYQTLLEETVYPKYKEIKAKAIAKKLLEAKLVYGYFPCQSDGNDLIIYEDDEKTEKMRFTFPRQPIEQRGSKNLCLADFFAPKKSGKIDVVPFHLVTMGRKASEHSAKLFKNDDYTDYLLFHGLSVESAEALAELWHKRIREELGFAGNDAPEMTKLFKQGYQGSRYSFGYPACPNLEDQTKLFELLNPERIDVSLTDEFMLDPEQSTSAIILHHPEAKYFGIG